MALGFQRQGMFGRKPSMVAAPQQGGMPIGIEQLQQPAKPKFFGQGGVGRAIAGTIGDYLLQQSGMQPIYAPNVLQQRDAEERARMAQQQRMQRREDLQWEWQNKPKDAPNNDTVNDFQWYKNLSEEDRKLYHQMKPAITYDSLGRPVVVNPYEAQQQSGPKAGAIEDGHEFLGGDPSNPANWRKVSGGQPVAPAAGFR